MSAKKYSITNTAAASETKFPTPESGQVIYWDKTPGLGLRITSAGSRSWIVQGRVNNKSRRFTLAPIAEMPHTEAREEAAKVRAMMRKGIDPLVEKKKRQQEDLAQGETLRQVMEDYVTHKKTSNGPLRPSTKADYRYCVEHTFADWADKPVATISRDDVVLKFRELSKAAPIQTNQSFRYLKALLNWAREKHAAADGTYTILPVNPVSMAIRKGGLVQWNPEKARDSRIPKTKIGAVWAMLEEYGNPDHHRATTCTSADLIAFMLLTGARVSEASMLIWDRVKLDADIPTFHLAETKNHNPVTLPISDALHAVLTRRFEARLKGNDHVFPAMRGKAGYMKDPRALLTKVSEIAGEHIHPHALRRTFLDVAQVVGVDSDQRRQLSNHLASDIHGINYENNPDPSLLMPAAQKIGEWITRQGSVARAAAQGENVVPMKA
ncbi:tyrosine-type recombinase/integrase [Halomonas stenophila]|uniref:Integrase n=1 Tax=Halomonas stenophila TaxID=795312 RepID=A0A7W5ET45_9GAMM|nr:integrase arm-type DNA-binding domain-containing protein [Halomonas stenophila]MBB3230954.1 integrase [Halomonas stenophila]